MLPIILYDLFQSMLQGHPWLLRQASWRLYSYYLLPVWIDLQHPYLLPLLSCLPALPFLPTDRIQCHMFKWHILLACFPKFKLYWDCWEWSPGSCCIIPWSDTNMLSICSQCVLRHVFFNCFSGKMLNCKLHRIEAFHQCVNMCFSFILLILLLLVWIDQGAPSWG